MDMDTHNQSSCSWRVRFALNLKGISYEYKAVDLRKEEQYTAEFEKLNPMYFVPVLVDGDTMVSDSFAILLYLEEKYPQKALLPRDLRLKALNLQAASIISSSVQPLQMLNLLKYIEEKAGPEERLSWARYVIERGFQALEKLLENVATRYATGDEVCLADVFLAPQIGASTLRFQIDMVKFPTLRRIHESYKTLPEYTASLPESQPDATI
ncbi:glutathione S-transferase zeta class-like isoform X1 [Rhodamnia argentea]|uniref:Glutathione S-transferase zeta class-like isoform X1 n=1 Tax=Rhodamnia argentea TaxID=178133 RepID=A0ABM3HW59_9MYRT|nr:glutathione S-transferase zeta class-like isoform X1 [Rhodamnia argentea]